MYKCPDCESMELDVTVQTMARLVQDEDGPQTLADEAQHGSDHEWDNNSVMICRECGFQAIAEEFEVDDEEDADDDEAVSHV